MAKKKKPKTIGKKQLKSMILVFFEENQNKTFNYKQVGKALRMNSVNSRSQIQLILEELVSESVLKIRKRGSYFLNYAGAYVTGRIQLNKKRPAMLICEDEKEEVIISQGNLNHALNNDLVKVFIYARKRKFSEGEVVEVLERATEQFVGILKVSPHYAFLISDSHQMPYDIFIPRSAIGKAKDNDKVIVVIDDWPTGAKNPIGSIKEILGQAGRHNTEMHAILAEFELPLHFSDKVLAEAEKISETISKAEIKNRRDFRDVLTFTIDPADAKDFDDAISFKKIADDRWEVGVHIADVTHYIKPGSILDQEAFERATSIYLVDRVVPMLPERLSNGVCSLRPHEDKLCYSVIFEMNKQAEILSYSIEKTIINSDYRFAYEDAQIMIETGEGSIASEIQELNLIAQLIRKQRFEKGSINFERKEIRFILADDGRPTGVYFKVSKDANHLIEEFMLLANKTIALHIQNLSIKGKNPFIYRIHDKPNSEKLEHLSNFVKRFGYNLSINSKSKIANSLNEMIEDSKEKPYRNLVEVLAVRTMAKAVYSSFNIGHYGLSFDFYSHFTSPIRRYPDMIAHRLLFDYITRNKPNRIDLLEDDCEHCSDMEQRAVNAERSSIKYKQVEFMREHIGEEFGGIISGVTSWGLYVELIDNGCEGLVSLRSLDDDYYIYDEDEMAIVGRSHKRKYQLGDEVRIQVAGANLIKKQLDFELIHISE